MDLSCAGSLGPPRWAGQLYLPSSLQPVRLKQRRPSSARRTSQGDAAVSSSPVLPFLSCRLSLTTPPPPPWSLLLACLLLDIWHGSAPKPSLLPSPCPVAPSPGRGSFRRHLPFHLGLPPTGFAPSRPASFGSSPPLSLPPSPLDLRLTRYSPDASAARCTFQPRSTSEPLLLQWWPADLDDLDDLDDS
ncbi:uncharacterized protein PSFLO_05987 [Pseudozyma flocculosa]|uniref:Uncharacterized protein n=1 Tax=Pseudozyma flocculosa TaxID=84751 RepID=A0A5C3FA33_9BASI|nr:uncharacterized protein PSFLO_05987 [Pseudozyma flocculosa]